MRGKLKVQVVLLAMKYYRLSIQLGDAMCRQMAFNITRGSKLLAAA
jgi:hypothetical protein